jgi:hypothetical protein
MANTVVSRGDLLIRSAVVSSSSTVTVMSAPNSADAFLAGVPHPHTARSYRTALWP